MGSQKRAMWQAALDLGAAVVLALAFVFARQGVTRYAVWAGLAGVLLFIGATAWRMGGPSDEAAAPLPRTTDAELM